MAIWGGWNTSIQDNGDSVAQQEMAIAQRIAMEEERKAMFKKEAFDMARATAGPQARQKVGFEAGRAAAVGMRQEVSFSREQEMLQEMFGQGDKIWGTQMEPVRINNDLNSSRSDPADETAGMFGFGPHGQKSGMF